MTPDDANDLLDAAVLRVEIGDGTSGPLIRAIDMTSGIFVNQFGTLGLPGRQAQASADTAGTDVLASGLFARLEIDTTGYFVSDGPWDLKLSTSFGDTQLVLDGATKGNTTLTPYGSLQLTGIPEPGALTMLAGLALAGLPVAVRRLRRRR